jgi:hypothetical protein
MSGRNSADPAFALGTRSTHSKIVHAMDPGQPC